MAQKVLVVDDDPIMHRVLRHYLQRIGYEIIAATNGSEGVELSTSQHPDLIILDVRMPEMGGLAALRELKDKPSTKSIPVIIVTVHADRTTHMESELSGAAAFLAKPFRPAELLATVQRLLPAQQNAGCGPKAH